MRPVSSQDHEGSRVNKCIVERINTVKECSCVVSSTTKHEKDLTQNGASQSAG